MVRKEKESAGYKPNQGDRIICQSNNVPYEAKVLLVGKDPKDTEKNPDTKYFVHYAGWNKNWDEWVKIDRIQEYTEENVKAMVAAKEKPKKGPSSTRKKVALQAQEDQNTSSISTSQDSLDASMIIDTEEPILIDKEIKIRIPDEIKAWLIDDDNNIKNKKLSVLPAKPAIMTILKDFINHKKSTTRNANEAMLSELTLGIKDYFNVMLGPHLLYKFERLQYQQILKEYGKDADLTAYYGVIHLARLFTKIGKILAHSTLEPQNVQTIVGYMQELLKFISKQSNLFDIEKNYTVAPPDYIKNALK